MAELLVAMTLLVCTLLPLSFSLASQRRLARAYYQRAVAMEIVDGEMEALMAGSWRNFGPGRHDYPVTAAAAVNLSPGRFLLTMDAHTIRLDWQPAARGRGGPVTREATIP
jgi:hypothetical protein